MAITKSAAPAKKSSSQNDDRQIPSVSEFKLANGVEGVFIDIPNCPAMSFEIAFRAGYYLCPEDKPDLAHFLEHLVLMANEDHPSNLDFSRAIQINGGSRNAETGPVSLCYSFYGPDFDWSRLFDLMLVAVSKPLFLSSEFDSERQVVRQEHKIYLDDRMRRLEQITLRRLGHPLARSDECLACLDSISIEDIKSYHRQTHTLSNSQLLLAGHLPESRRELIKQKLSSLDLPKGDGRPTRPHKRLAGAGLIYEPEPEAETAHCFLSLTEGNLVLNSQEFSALSLICSILMSGDDSWIYGYARDKGLIYHMANYFESLAGSVHFDLLGQTDPSKLEQLFDLILAAIDRLMAGDFPDDEVDYHKSYNIGRSQVNYLGPRRWLDYLRGEYLGLDLILPVDHREHLGSVDKGQIVALARKLFGSFDWTLGLLGDVPEETRNRIEAKFNRRKAGK